MHGREVDLVQKLIRIQSFGQLMVSHWNSSGISSWIHHNCSLSVKFPVKNEYTNRRFHTTDHLNVDVQPSMNISLTLKGNREAMRMQRSARFLFLREDFHQENGHSSDLDQRTSGSLFTNTKTTR